MPPASARTVVGCNVLRSMSPLHAHRVISLRCRSLDAIGGTADIRRSRCLGWSDAIDPKQTSRRRRLAHFQNDQNIVANAAGATGGVPLVIGRGDPVQICRDQSVARGIKESLNCGETWLSQ